MMCTASAALTLRLTLPIDMLMHYMFVLTCIFSFQRANNKCMRGAGLENGSLLLNVDSATLPPSGAQAECRRGGFIIFPFRLLMFAAFCWMLLGLAVKTSAADMF